MQILFLAQSFAHAILPAGGIHLVGIQKTSPCQVLTFLLQDSGYCCLVCVPSFIRLESL